jgi:hypothetical protein
VAKRVETSNFMDQLAGGDAAAILKIGQEAHDGNDDTVNSGGGGDGTTDDVDGAVLNEDSVNEEGVNDGSGDGADGGEGGDTGESTDNIKTLADLAKAIEVDPEFLYGLEIKLADNGEAIPIGEIKDRLQQHERQKRDFDAARAQFLQERHEFLQGAQQYQQQAGTMFKEQADAMEELRGIDWQIKSIDWDKFSEIDAGKAAVERQKLWQARQEAAEKLQTVNTQAQQVQAQQYQQAKAYHDSKLLEAVPTWRDPETARREVGAMVNWATTQYGFQDQELAGAIDWRHRDILRKAYLYDQIQTQTQKITRNPPKTLGRGMAPATQGTTEAKKLKKLIDRAKTTRKRNDQVDAARAVLDKAFNIKR